MAEFPITIRPPIGPDIPLPWWRENVGRPVALDLAPPPADAPGRSVAVLSWNAWIGRGDLAGLVTRIRAGAYVRQGFPAGLPFVALIQEAYRTDASIPAAATGYVARDFSRRGGREHEIVSVARELTLNLAYAPSMRNGTHRSDRGNAILSSLPLQDPAAVELPFVLQRRVAISATLRVGDRALRLHSVHFDPRGATARDLLGVAGRLSQARALVEALGPLDGVPQILGADLNLAREEREPAFEALAAAGFVTGIPAVPPAWPHTYHRLPRLNLDWLLFASPAGPGGIGRAEVQRLDEHPRDLGPYVYGSDHHPLLARIDLDP